VVTGPKPARARTNGRLDAFRRNGILASLPLKELQQVRPHLEEVELGFGQVLADRDKPISNAYFVTKGVISLIVNLADGSSVEVASVGSESLVGAGGLLRLPKEPHTTLVQAIGTAYKIEIPKLQKLFHACPQLREAILRNLYIQTSQMAQTAACNRVHEVEQRLARWLLMAQDRIASDELLLTHEFLALMLGVRRAGVTVALQHFETRGLITTARGSIVIKDRDGLEEGANGLYGAPEAEFERLFPASG